MLRRILATHLRKANFFTREDLKKPLWNSLIWKLRDVYSRQGHGPRTNIKAKVDLAQNRAVVSGIPGAAEIRIIEFVPDSVALNGILRLRNQAGAKLAEKDVYIPFRLSSVADRKRLVDKLWTELVELISKVKYKETEEPAPAPQPAPMPAAPNITGHNVMRAVFDVLKSRSPWEVYSGWKDGQEMHSGRPESIGLKTPAGDFRVSISFGEGTAMWDLYSAWYGVSANPPFEGHESGVNARNLGAVARKMALSILQAANKLLQAEADKKKKEQEQTTSRAGLIDRVRSSLKGMRFGPAGRASKITVDDTGGNVHFTVDPMNRERLDHYVGEDWDDRRDDEDDPESWDSDAWNKDYVTPIIEAIEPKLMAEFGNIFEVEVGEKGHIDVMLVGSKIPAR